MKILKKYINDSSEVLIKVQKILPKLGGTSLPSRFHRILCRLKLRMISYL